MTRQIDIADALEALYDADDHRKGETLPKEQHTYLIIITES